MIRGLRIVVGPVEGLNVVPWITTMVVCLVKVRLSCLGLRRTPPPSVGRGYGYVSVLLSLPYRYLFGWLGGYAWVIGEREVGKMHSDLGTLAILVNNYRMDTDAAEKMITRVSTRKGKRESVKTPDGHTLTVTCAERERVVGGLVYPWFTVEVA